MKRQRKSMVVFWLVAFSSMLLVSCGPTIFQEYTSRIKEPLTLLQVRANPINYKGSFVIWGGKIVNTLNKHEGTYLEVLFLPLDYAGKPRDVDASEGRFKVIYQGFLDPAIYGENRKVTVAGTVEGVDYISIGETRHTVPLIRAEKIRLWEREIIPPEYSCGDFCLLPRGYIYWHFYHRCCRY